MEPETHPEPKTGFLEESAGVKSSTRLIAIMFAGFAIGFTLIVYFTGGKHVDTALFSFATIASIALGGKIIQKPMERK